MARVDCPKTAAAWGATLSASFSGNAVTMTAADTSNFNSFKQSAVPCVLLIYGGTAGGTYTIQSTADPQGRTGDLTAIAIAALAIHALYFNQATLPGWGQTDNTIWIKGSVNTILFGVVQVPG